MQRSSADHPVRRVRRAGRGLAVLAVGAVVALGAGLLGPTPGHADPTGIQPTGDVASQIGRLSAQLNQADQDLRQASITASVAIERYERAVDDENRAITALAAARDKAKAAGARVDKQRDVVDVVARDNYELGGTIGATALLVSGRPSDLLRNVEYLRFVTHHQTRALGDYRQASGRAVLAEGTARSALRVRTAARRKAADTKKAAQDAVERRANAVADIKDRRAGLQHQLDTIEAHNTKARAAAAAQQRRQAAARAEQRRNADSATADATGNTWSTRGGGAMLAVRTALAQVGKEYVWDAADPDVGFDCSGLALYAYEQLGIELPHSAEYQYLRGYHVSSDNLRPGDLLFYSYNGQVSGIHHVTMYIGHGQIVQAADFGIPIQVVPAYFSFGYIGATRLVG